MRALIVGSVPRDLFGAGTKTGDRYYHLGGHRVLAPGELADKRDLIVHQAPYARNGSSLGDEVGKAHLNMAGFGL